MKTTILAYRLLWADSLRGILMLLVVLGHAIQFSLGAACFDNHLWNYISSFHVPAFMVVSGYLNYHGADRPLQAVVSRRFWQLLVPCLLWSLVKYFVFEGGHSRPLLHILLYPDRYYWFLWVLFFISLFFQFGNQLAAKLRCRQEWVIGGMSLLLVLVMVFGEIRVFGFQFFAYYFLFYSLGYYLHKYPRLTTKSRLALLLLTVLWAVSAWFWRMDSMPAVLAAVPLPHALLHYGHRFVTAILAVYVLLCASPMLLESDKAWNRCFIKAGRLSLGLYAAHLLFVQDLSLWLTGHVGNQAVAVALSFVLSLSLAYVLVWLLNRWHLTRRFLLGKV